ncbi:VOC family protein [Ktedonosporobacter rubrisoli]|uniref:VOC family protein n=1 Tax=Ktedonosporobacter rubrisoli TaxID=2509675 RepID=A0A4V0YYR4_KTERU|nr:VOC family protein [Ktedonosporobacter rubrisoli]QBD77131.1 VOC family protein [Ktedonosporobacter rubrisoli]
MLVMPIVYVSDVERSMRFYELLGFKLVRKHRKGRWAELRLGDAKLGLHYLDKLSQSQEQQRVDLGLESQEPLEELQERLIAAGIPLERFVSDEAFGYSLVIRDPDGLHIQINQHDPELYT